MSDSKRVYHPWHIPFLVLGGLFMAGLWFTTIYGPMEEWQRNYATVLIGAIVFWGWIRSLQPGPSSTRPPSSAMAPVKPLPERLRWAFGYAIVMAIGFTAIAILVSYDVGLSEKIRFGLSLRAIIAAYWLAAILCGLFLAILQPYTRYRLGAFVVGSLIGCAIYGTAMLALPASQSIPWWLPLIPGTVLGGGLGLVWVDAR